MNFIKKIFIIFLSVILLLLSLLLISGCAEQTKPENSANPESDKSDITHFTANLDDLPNSDSNSNDGNEAEAQETGSGICEDGFVFIYNGVPVYMGEYIENILPEIGPYADCYENESCTSAGMMQAYCYSGLEISAYAKTEADEFRIFSVILIDDSISTAEGIYIGQTVGDMTAAYGAEYETLPGIGYKYVKNGTSLFFDVDGDIITAITYTLLNV